MRSRLSLVSLLLVSFVVSGCVLAADTTSRPILVLYAFAEEGEALAKFMSTDTTYVLHGHPVYRGTLYGKKIVVAESGGRDDQRRDGHPDAAG